MAGNKFSNDGSFMDMFRKRMEEDKQGAETKSEKKTEFPKKRSYTESKDEMAESSSVDAPKCNRLATDTSDPTKKKMPVLPFVGKRRGKTPVLKTGAVEKKANPDAPEDPSTQKDAWSRYMAEVNKYKFQSCQDDDKTRPLVK